MTRVYSGPFACWAAAEEETEDTTAQRLLSVIDSSVVRKTKINLPSAFVLFFFYRSVQRQAHKKIQSQNQKHLSKSREHYTVTDENESKEWLINRITVDI